MKKIPLTAVPNQAIPLNAGRQRLEDSAVPGLDMMNADISRDGVIVCHWGSLLRRNSASPG